MALKITVPTTMAHTLGVVESIHVSGGLLSGLLGGGVTIFGGASSLLGAVSGGLSSLTGAISGISNISNELQGAIGGAINSVVGGTIGGLVSQAEGAVAAVASGANPLSVLSSTMSNEVSSAISSATGAVVGSAVDSGISAMSGSAGSISNVIQGAVGATVSAGITSAVNDALNSSAAGISLDVVSSTLTSAINSVVSSGAASLTDSLPDVNSVVGTAMTVGSSPQNALQNVITNAVGQGLATLQSTIGSTLTSAISGTSGGGGFTDPIAAASSIENTIQNAVGGAIGGILGNAGIHIGGGFALGGLSIGAIGINMPGLSILASGINLGGLSLTPSGMSLGGMSLGALGMTLGSMSLGGGGLSIGSNVSVSAGGITAGNNTLTSNSLTVANANVTNTLTVNSVYANGSFGTNLFVLTSNGTSVYWGPGVAANAGVTLLNTGVGLTGGPITTTGTVSALPNTGIIANTSGLFVDPSYIATINANNAAYLGDIAAASYLTAAVTSVATGNGILGGTITTTGTLYVKANTGIISNTSGLFFDPSPAYIFTGVETFNANVFVNTAILSVGNTTANVTTNTTTIFIGNNSVSATANSTVYSGTANNATYFSSEPASYYTNATNITTGTLPWAQLPPGPAIGTVTSSSSITPNSADGQYEVTALAVGTTFQIPSGSPADGQKLMIRIKDNGSAQTLAWTTSAGGYRIVGVTLPTTTVINKILYVGCIYNSQDSFWDVVATAQQA